MRDVGCCDELDQIPDLLIHHPFSPRAGRAPTCARPSLEEGNDETLKLLLKSRGDETRPAKARPPAGSESCVASGRPVLRSVDSECVGLCD